LDKRLAKKCYSVKLSHNVTLLVYIELNIRDYNQNLEGKKWVF